MDTYSIPTHKDVMAVTKQQTLCLWSGPAFAVLFGIGFWALSGFLPVPSSAMSAEEVAVMYHGHTVMIRLGQLVLVLASALLVPWAALISTQMRKIPTCGDELVQCQFFGGASNAVFFIVAALFVMITAFRPERDPQITQALNDISWIMLVAPVSLAMLQVAALGLAILADTRTQPVFPRWAGYYNVSAAVVYVLGIAAPFFHSGPFSWGGLFPFWIPAAEFFAWFFVMFVLLRRAIEVSD